jgi:hypothetical protein
VIPLGDGATSVIEAKEQDLVQQFIAHATVETLDKAVLHRFAGRDVVPFDAVLL